MGVIKDPKTILISKKGLAQILQYPNCQKIICSDVYEIAK